MGPKKSNATSKKKVAPSSTDDDDWEALLEAETTSFPSTNTGTTVTEQATVPVKETPISTNPSAKNAAVAFLAAQGKVTISEDSTMAAKKKKKNKKKTSASVQEDDDEDEDGDEEGRDKANTTAVPVKKTEEKVTSDSLELSSHDFDGLISSSRNTISRFLPRVN
jgi:hypothetical protein